MRRTNAAVVSAFREAGPEGISYLGHAVQYGGLGDRERAAHVLGELGRGTPAIREMLAMQLAREPEQSVRERLAYELTA